MRIEKEKILARCKQERICIAEDYAISAWGSYIAFYGRMLFVFKTDGSLVIRRKDLKYIQEIAFISEERILVACNQQEEYVVLSLQDGSECWHTPYPKSNALLRRFFKSSDDTKIYELFSYLAKTCFLEYDLENKNIVSLLLKPGLRCVSDVIFDETDVPCLLVAHYEEIGGKYTSYNGVQLLHGDFSESGTSYHWKYKWEMEHPRIAKFFLGDAHTVLTDDLYVYDLKSGTSYYLLENESNWGEPNINNLMACRIDEERRYIALAYVDMTVFVDWKERKMVARYAVPMGFGQRIGNEFWSCSKEGVTVKPFPILEDIPPKKKLFWGDILRECVIH